MVPMDYTIRAGNRLCLILYGTDVEATQRPITAVALEVDQSTVRAEVPFLRESDGEA